MRVDNKRIDVTSKTIGATIETVRPYALMSALAYRPYGPSNEIPTNETQPLRHFNEWLSANKWEFQSHNKFKCATEISQYLEFDLWLNTNKSPTQLVVAFRGTHEAPDWLSNLRGVLPWARWADQYARIHFSDVEQAITNVCGKAGTNCIIVATGHSLGGGLAQHLFYCSQIWNPNQVHRAYVFDSSPMTGWYQYGDKRERSNALTVFRQNQDKAAQAWEFPEVMTEKYGFGTMLVNERGEILAWARGIRRVVFRYREESFMSVLNVELSKKGIMGKHSMKDLANNLLCYPKAAPALSEECSCQGTCPGCCVVTKESKEE